MGAVLELFLLEVVLQRFYPSCNIAQNVLFSENLEGNFKKVELGSLFIKIKFLSRWFVFLHGA